MTKYFVTLEKDCSGFGLGIVAMGVDPEIERLGIYVKHVVEGGAAEKAGMVFTVFDFAHVIVER